MCQSFSRGVRRSLLQCLPLPHATNAQKNHPQYGSRRRPNVLGRAVTYISQSLRGCQCIAYRPARLSACVLPKALPSRRAVRLMAAIRPEFRGDVLVFAPGDPIFGGPACRVAGCGRSARSRGMCTGHWDRWADAGRPGIEMFAASPGKPWHGHAPLAACAAVGCGFGVASGGLCPRHLSAWQRAACPGPGWRAAALPLFAWPPKVAVGYVGASGFATRRPTRPTQRLGSPSARYLRRGLRRTHPRPSGVPCLTGST